ncbi:MAG: hypothetical protein WAO35_25430 [Terriglobia bacterium]
MAKYGLFTSNGKLLQEYEGDRMDQDKDLVQIIKEIPNEDGRLVATIHLVPGQSVKPIEH